MTWFANLLIIIGLVLVGYKNRFCFVFSILGELIWTVVSIIKEQYDLAFICIVFCCIAFRNFLKWSKDEKN